MSRAIRFAAEEVRIVASGAVGAPYSTVGDPMTHPIRTIIFQNTMDTGLMLSFDGVTDHLPIITNGYMAIDIASNKTSPQGFYLAEGQQIFVRQLGGVPSSGSLYVSVFYGAEI